MSQNDIDNEFTTKLHELVRAHIHTTDKAWMLKALGNLIGYIAGMYENDVYKLKEAQNADPKDNHLQD